MISHGLYDGRFTSSVKERFTGLVRSAFREVIRDAVKSRLSSALADTEPELEEVQDGDGEEIITTEEEREGFMIIRAIVREVFPANRIVMRDARCAMLLCDPSSTTTTGNLLPVSTSIARGSTSACSMAKKKTAF
jgi:predicted type IV restriction endonuclease